MVLNVVNFAFSRKDNTNVRLFTPINQAPNRTFNDTLTIFIAQECSRRMNLRELKRFLNKNAKLQKRYNRKLSYVLKDNFVTNENEKYFTPYRLPLAAEKVQ